MLPEAMLFIGGINLTVKLSHVTIAFLLFCTLAISASALSLELVECFNGSADVLETEGQYVYIGQTSMFYIISADPSQNFDIIGEYDVSKIKKDWVVKQIEVEDDYAYIIPDDSTVLILNITNPETPQYEGKYEHSKMYKIKVVDKLAYLLFYDSAATNNGLYFMIVDMSNPKNPPKMGQYKPSPSPMICPKEFWIENDTAYLVDDSMILTLDISDPENPIKIKKHLIKDIELTELFDMKMYTQFADATLNSNATPTIYKSKLNPDGTYTDKVIPSNRTPIKDTAVHNGLMYISAGTVYYDVGRDGKMDKIIVYNVTDPEAPVLLDNFTITRDRGTKNFSAVWESDIDNYFHAWEMSIKRYELKTFDVYRVNNIESSEDFVYLKSYEKVMALRVSAPHDPSAINETLTLSENTTAQDEVLPDRINNTTKIFPEEEPSESTQTVETNSEKSPGNGESYTIFALLCTALYMRIEKKR